jgi:transposase
VGFYPDAPGKKVYPPELVEAVRDLYVGQGKSVLEIASALTISYNVVYRLMRNHHLPIRPREERQGHHKVYPAYLVEAVEDLYVDKGMTMMEIATRLSISRNVVYGLMRNHRLPIRSPSKRDQSGDKNASWKGDKAGYAACHLRVVAARGKPSECWMCGRTDSDISYDWASISGHYADVDDFARMCRSCHSHWDIKRRAATGQRTSTWNGVVAKVPYDNGFEPPV